MAAVETIAADAVTVGATWVVDGWDMTAALLRGWQVLRGMTAAQSLESQSHHHLEAPGQ